MIEHRYKKAIFKLNKLPFAFSLVLIIMSIFCFFNGYKSEFSIYSLYWGIFPGLLGVAFLFRSFSRCKVSDEDLKNMDANHFIIR